MWVVWLVVMNELFTLGAQPSGGETSRVGQKGADGRAFENAVSATARTLARTSGGRDSPVTADAKVMTGGRREELILNQLRLR